MPKMKYYDETTSQWVTLDAKNAEAITDGVNTITPQQVVDLQTGLNNHTSNADIHFTSTERAKLSGIAANANNYTLPNATTTALGGVKVGTNISVSTGTISVANASTTTKGVVQLNNTTTSTSTTEALAANQGKVLNDKIDVLTGNLGTTNNSLTTLDSKVNQHESKVASATELGHVKVGTNLSITPDGTLNASGGTPPDASTTQKGIVQLNDTTTSTSTTQAATANAVKQVKDIIPMLNDSIASSSSSTAASSRAVKLVNDKLIGDNVLIGSGAVPSASGSGNIAIGTNASASSGSSVAIGYFAQSLNNYGFTLGIANHKVIVPGSFSVTGTKQFEIPHPNPPKKYTHVLRHGAVESPTAGDTLYRYYIDIKGDIAEVKMVGSEEVLTLTVIQTVGVFKLSITLPDYWIHLNINDQTFVNADEHFGNGFGKVNYTNETLELTFGSIGKYNVALYGTRNDNHDSVQSWNIKGAVREIGESWNGETYSFEIDEITEITEFEEVLQ